MTASSSTALQASHSSRTGLLADACLFGVALIWGINIPIMKTGLEQVDSFVFNAIRLSISAVVLATFAFRERSRGELPKPGITRRTMIAYGVIVSALYQILFLMGIDRTTSGNTALIICTVPVWTALLASIFIGERLRRLAWAGLGVALTGTAIVAFQKGDVTADQRHLVGNLLMLGAALTWSGGTVFSRRLLKLISPMQLSAAGALIALPIHLLVAGPHFEAGLPALSSGTIWLIVIYAGVLSSGLALPMWNYGVRHAGPAHAATIQNLIPLVAIVAAWTTRAEIPTVAQIAGGILILGGLVIMRAGRQASEPTSIDSGDRNESV